MDERKVFYHKLWTLVMPIAFQQLMLAAVSASDAIMLGAVKQDSLSAVSLAGQVQFVLNLFLAALTIGTSMFAAQYWGKGDKDAVERIFGIVLKTTFLITLVFFLGAVCIPETLMYIFTSDKALIAGGATYLRVVGISYLFTGISQIYLCILKNTGRVGKSTVISSTAVLLNILLNAILIFGLFGFPRMEIAGAALATVLSRVLELTWAMLESGRKDAVKARLCYLIHTDALLKKDIWRHTLPVLANELFWGCGFTMYSVIMGHLGSDAVAANSIANIVKNMAACFCIGLGSGGGIMVGNELGNGTLERAKRYGDRLCKLSIISGAVSGLILLAISPLVLRLVSLNAQSMEYLKWMLVMCSYYMIGKSISCTTIAGIFCAGGDSRFGLICDMVNMWLVIVPLGLIAAFVWKLPVLAVYFILNLDEMTKIPMEYIHYKKYLWVKDLTRKHGTIAGQAS